MAKSSGNGPSIEPRTARLPSTRESRPAMIGLAVLLIVGGALASAFLAIQSGNRASYLVVTEDVAQGAEFTPDELGTVSLPEDFEGGIRASERDKVVGQSAGVRLLKGTVLSPSMTSEEGGVPSGKARLTILVEASSVRGIRPGASLALALASNDDTTIQPVAADLVRVGKVESGGFGSTTTSTRVPVQVDVAASCFAVVSQGVADNTVNLGLISSGGSAARENCAA